MKCFASFVILALTCVISVFAIRNEVGRPNINGFYYACYEDGKATLTGTTHASYYSYIIPDYVTYQGKQYKVTIVQANAFNGSQFTKISVHSKNTALLLRPSALNGVKGLKEFNFNSVKVEPEIDAFKGVGTTTNFQGAGIPYSLEKLSIRYLKKWKLPYGKNYQGATEMEKMQDLYLLAKNMQRTFSIYDKITNPNAAATIALAKQGSRDAFARLYRVMAMVMGIPENQILVGCDTIKLCWNYVYIDPNNKTNRNWHVVNALQSIADSSTMNTAYFQKERNFIKNTLKPFYGSNTNVQSSKFIVHLDVYNYIGENKYNKNMNFDEWIEKNNMYYRTY